MGILHRHGELQDGLSPTALLLTVLDAVGEGLQVTPQASGQPLTKTAKLEDAQLP